MALDIKGAFDSVWWKGLLAHLIGVLVFGIRSLESLNPTDIYKLLATPPGADPGFSERGV